MEIAADICVYTNDNVIVESYRTRHDLDFTPARNRLRARPLHRRPERRQARRRDRAAQPLAPPAAARGLREEVLPKNILMIGPTGVGKTEIARRLAKLAQAPFLKVEATKFTEVGYVGRDVEQIMRDLVEIAHRHDARAAAQGRGGARPSSRAEERVLDALVGANASRTRARSSARCCATGELDDKEIEIEVQRRRRRPMPTFEIPGMPGAQMGMINLGDMLGKAFGGRTKPRRMTVAESHERADRRGERQAARPGEA